jgi:hypothetical protein
MKRSTWLFFLILASTIRAEEAPQGLLEYAKKVQGRQAYGVYVQNKKIGWSTLESKLARLDDKDVFVVAEESSFELKRGRESVKMRLTSTTTYALDGRGDIIRMEETSTESGGITRKGERRGDGFVITSSTDPDKERKVAVPKKNFAATRKFEEWLRSEPAKGSTFEFYVITLEDADVDTKEVYTYLAKKSLAISGIKTDVFHVKSVSKGAESDLEVRPDGTPLRGTVGGFLEIRAEPEEAAKKVTPAEIDLLALASIPADRDIGEPDAVEALTLSVEGLGEYPLPVTHRQVRKDDSTKDRSVILELRRDFKPEMRAPLTDAERKKMLGATPTVQSDHEKVRELAKEIVGDETDVHKKAVLIKRWVYRNLRKSFKDNATTSLEVLRNKAGDCTEHALLFAALARAAGIPAREVGGVAYYSDGKPLFGWHAWAEYHDGHHWASIDPTWNQDRIDATHVKFSDSGDDMTWINVLGKVKFKVVKVEKE